MTPTTPRQPEPDPRADGSGMRDAALLAAIVETSNDAIMSVSREGLLTSWNPAATRIYGYTAEEALGRTPPSLLIREGDVDDSTELMQRVLSGELLTGVEVRRRRKDGTPIDISMTLSPVYDSSGTFIGASVIARDITHDRQVAKELQEAEFRHRNLVEQVPVIIYDWGVSGDLDHVTENYVSPHIEAVLGFAREEWMDDPSLWFSRVHPDDQAEVTTHSLRSIEGALPFSLEYRMIAKDGRVVWIRDEAVVLKRDEQGKASLFQGVQLDITAEKNAEATLRKTTAERTQLIQLLAHELFTPLTSIQGAAMTLHTLGDRLDPDDLQSLADGVARGATRLRRLVRNLDAAAKLDRDDITMSRESVAVGEIVDLALREFQFEMEASDIHVSVDPELATCPTLADLSLASQALGVVIENALDYSAGAPVEVELLPDVDDVLIRVSDRGPGVPIAERELIFDLFTQVDSSDTREHEGLGVGLFLARRVMLLHGGELTYEDREDGGSTFVLRFPKEPATP